MQGPLPGFKKAELEGWGLGEPHWVEELFPPHFTALDLLEDTLWRSGKPGVRPQQPGLTRKQRANRRQEIYQEALLEVKLREERNRQEKLAGRMVREETGKGVTGPIEHRVGFEEEGRSIWNGQDLSTLARSLYQAERERCRLGVRLQQAETEAEQQREEHRKLQGRLEEREQQLALAGQAAALQALRLEALQAEGRGREVASQAWAAEARGRGEVVRKASEALRKTKVELQETLREKKALAREADCLRRQLEDAGRGWTANAQPKDEAILEQLQSELKDARAELHTERQRHAQTRAALELLRRHFPSQSQPTLRLCIDRITHM